VGSEVQDHLGNCEKVHFKQKQKTSHMENFSKEIRKLLNCFLCGNLLQNHRSFNYFEKLRTKWKVIAKYLIQIDLLIPVFRIAQYLCSKHLVEHSGMKTPNTTQFPASKVRAKFFSMKFLRIFLAFLAYESMPIKKRKASITPEKPPQLGNFRMDASRCTGSDF
jgi:hypothetical protein